jgi:diacylglycerol kinase (ATP)
VTEGPLSGFVRGFGHAYRGLLLTLGQRNMKIHVVSAILVGIVGSTIPLGLAEKVSLIFCVLLLFFSEILNTALEALVDLHTREYDELARVTKDTAAAGVLVLAIGAVVIFAAIVVYNWAVVVESWRMILRQALVGTPLVLACGVLLAPGGRSAAVDGVLFLVALVAWGALWPVTVSWVFTTLTGGLVVLCWRAARVGAGWHRSERAG